MKTFDDRKKSVQQYMMNMQRKRRKTAITLTSLALVVSILALVLFIPYDTTPPDVRMYAESEYYGLIQRINELTYQPPKHKNNFEAMLEFVSDFGVKSDHAINGYPMPGAPMPQPTVPGASPAPDNQDPSNKGEQYEEVTDNQVQGVIEADIFKRSDRYVYYLRGSQLSVYSIAQDDSQRVGIHIIQYAEEGNEDWAPLHYLNATEMFLSADCRTVTVLLQGYHKTNGTMTLLVSLDVSDPANITEKNRVYFVGSYLSSRMVDGDILLTYNYGFRLADVDFIRPETFVPQYGTPGNWSCIPGDAIVYPEDVSSARYTVICKLSGDTLEVEGTTALLGYSQELYVSEDTIYATRSYTQKNKETADNQYRQCAMTEITGISYTGDTLEFLGTIAVEGSVRNQYSMDQFEGILRVVTSTTTSYLRETPYGEFTSVTTSAVEYNVNLYCIDLESWQIAAEVIAFAPNGEDAQSVRFDGTNAYVCTAEVITITDPVYFFDLSDLDNITWTDTGTIDGYSTSLIELGDGYLLGIGFSNTRKLKIEVYEECEDKVISVCAYERNLDFSTEYKSYLIDRENDLIGLAVRGFNSNTGNYWTQYLLLHFDGYQLNEFTTLYPIYGDMDSVRAFIADGWLYVLCDGSQDIFVQKVW